MSPRNPRHRNLISLIVWIVLPVVSLVGCAEPEEALESIVSSDANVVEVRAVGTSFEAPDEIPSGWTTFRLTNDADMAHFALVERMPNGYGVEEHQELIAPVFQQGMDLFNRGQVDSGLAVFGTLPEWFGEIVFLGGPGLTGKQSVSESTIYLEPGDYVMECYVKTDGLFHSYNPNPGKYGMAHGFTVTADSSGAPEPEPTIRIEVSSENGIQVEGEATAGEHTVAVHYVDQAQHENFLGHDVHLARLEPDTDLDSLAIWMDWSKPTGLETPAPVHFLGGNHEMPAGSTGYFNVTLEPGRYAWIAEVPNASEKDMLVEFEVEG